MTKVVWITGASSGIGEALAKKFNSKGWRVVLSARREAELQRVQSSLDPKTPSMILPLDLTSGSDFLQESQKVIDQFGQIDILINNGGMTARASAQETPIPVLRQVMEVDFFGHVAMTKAVLPHMLARRSGQIVITSSVAGKIGTKERSSYCAAKHAIIGYHDSLRDEVMPEITITTLLPGFIQTNIMKNAIDKNGQNSGYVTDVLETAMPVDQFADKAYAAIIAKKPEVLIGGKEIIMPYLRTLYPAWFFKFLHLQKTS